MNNYNALFLLGPRLSGKSTLGNLVSGKLGWKFHDMDEVIFSETGKTVDEITENGTNWQAFRNIELALIKRLLRERSIVVSCGGGVGVNNIVRDGTSKTFGELETELLNNASDIFKVVLLPNKAAFIERAKADESISSVTHRPLLDERKAEKIEKLLYSNIPEQEKQQLLIDEKIKSTLDSYDQRNDLYKALADLLIDTGALSIEECLAKIINSLEE
jgi:shikimate kinase